MNLLSGCLKFILVFVLLYFVLRACSPQDAPDTSSSSGSVSVSQETPSPSPEPTPTPEPIVYTTEVESLIALFEESAFDAKNHISDLEMQYLSEPGRVFISYNIENAWSEHDIGFMAFTNYVRFVQGLLAYQVEGVSEVKVSIRSAVVDNYGNESTVPVLAWNMSIESFQQYNWENLTLREGVFIQFLSDCETFWVAPFIEDEVDWNKVILWNTFEPEE